MKVSQGKVMGGLDEELGTIDLTPILEVELIRLANRLDGGGLGVNERRSDDVEVCSLGTRMSGGIIC